MKFFLSFLFIQILTININGYSPSVVHNTRITNSKGADVCFYDGIEIEKFRSANNPGKCSELFCDSQFNVLISKCFNNPSGRCHYEGVNYQLSYPDCCGIQLCS